MQGDSGGWRKLTEGGSLVLPAEASVVLALSGSPVGAVAVTAVRVSPPELDCAVPVAACVTVLLPVTL